MRQVLKTAEQVKAKIAETLLDNAFWQSKGVDIDIHFHDMSSDEVKLCNDVAIDNVQVCVVEFNADTVPALFGLREAKEGEAELFSIGKTRYATDNNQVNRYLAKDRGGALSESMLAGLWACGPGLTLSSSGQYINGAHRSYAAVIALSKEPTFKCLIPVEFGVPPQFRDLWDFKNREKKVNDLLFQNPSFMSPGLLATQVIDGQVVPIEDELTAKQVVDMRNKLSKDYTSFCNFVLMRLSGKHIHSRADDREVLKFTSRCAEAERLSYEVFRRSLNADGKVSDQFKRLSSSQWAAALLLASNSDHTDGGELVVNWEIVEKVLNGLNASTESAGPFAVTLHHIGQAFKNKKATLSRKGCFDTIVNSIKQYLAQDSVTDNPIPNAKQLDSKHYPTFGGVDIGYQEKVKED